MACMNTEVKFKHFFLLTVYYAYKIRIQSVQNLGVAGTGTAIGYIVDAKGYFILDLIFINYLAICLIGIFLLLVFDSLKGKNFDNKVLIFSNSK